MGSSSEKPSGTSRRATIFDAVVGAVIGQALYSFAQPFDYIHIILSIMLFVAVLSAWVALLKRPWATMAGVVLGTVLAQHFLTSGR